MTNKFREIKRSAVLFSLLFIINTLAATNSTAQTRNSDAQTNGRAEQAFAFQNQTTGAIYGRNRIACFA